MSDLRTAALYAVADLRALAQEAGETDPATSPALRAADRLRDAIAKHDASEAHHGEQGTPFHPRIPIESPA